ncbi:pantothenate kinase [Imtechella halotolerans K1]|uniref:Type III pantothenate kinase n=2 Tax=Imtechella TaxID=1165076 RepID=I0WI83_9FLAO|nr:pantothenate kinase [Imtechella halotolerans K1]
MFCKFASFVTYMNLVIDQGNTFVKLAVFENSRLVDLDSVSYCEAEEMLKKIFKKNEIKQVIWSSVGEAMPFFDTFLDNKVVLRLTSETLVPFFNNYGSPRSLGVDRIALAAAAAVNYPKKNVLVIDAGTCITFEFKNANDEYLGGAIAPGIQMRFKALHDYTAKLPLVSLASVEDFIGNNTETSILSGVVNNVVQEIDGVINQYLARFEDLTVILTGGDTLFLAERVKNTIFANPNFLLEGLNAILEHNTHG